MNANELADFLDDNVEAMLNKAQPYIDMAATMLREQQAEIEALKAHPVKDLTDDDIEIFKAAAPYYGIGCQSSTGLSEFIKQIVRKAQEQ